MEDITFKKRHSIDFLHGSLGDKILLFALPVAATAILEQLFNASDIAVVGNFSGAASTVAVAAVGPVAPVGSVVPVGATSKGNHLILIVYFSCIFLLNVLK